MKKKMFSVFLSIALAASLAACGSSAGNTAVDAGKENSGTSKPGSPDDVDLKELAANYDGEINIVLWGKDSIDPDKKERSRGWQFQRMADEYASQFDNVTIEYINQGSYDDVAEKIMAGATANDLPTAFIAEEASVKGFSGVAADIRDYVPSEVIQDFMPGLLVSMIDENDRLLAVPCARSLPVLYANQEMLDEAGWKIEDIKTNEDMMQAAKAVYEATGKPGYIMFWDTDAWHWESEIYADGGSVLSEDGQTVTFGKDNDYVGAKFLEMVQEGLKEGYVVSPYGTPKPGDTRDEMFTTGEAAMMLTSSNSMPKRADALAESGYTMVTAVQPAGEGGISMAGGGSNWMICDSASYEEKMIVGGYLAYISSADCVMDMVENNGNMMVTTSAQESERGKALLTEKPYYQAVYDSIEYLHERPNTTSWVEMYTYAFDKLEQFSLNYETTDVRAMIDEIQQKFEQIIADNAW